jgi:glycosyltransferase involved in cell wall biosynthesis
MTQASFPSTEITPAWRKAGLETLVPLRLAQPDSWAGHIPFAFWIIGAHKPRLLVELGVHTGNSYCAFNQAIAHLGLDTKSLGIDHWLGDPQAGFYGEDILAELRTHHDPLYGRFSSLLRMSFEDGRTHAADESVDLLHIDGLHTYDAVREDFETWRDKMSDRGIVLFHDTTVHTGDFGVWKFWEEVSARYPSFEFKHSNGLGVAYVGTKPIKDPDLAALFAAGDSPEGDSIRAYFARLGEGSVTQVRLTKVTQDLEDVSRKWETMRADVGEIEKDRLALRRERDALRQRVARADDWEDLALHCREGVTVELPVFARIAHRLYNADNPESLRDRHVLNRLLTRLYEDGSCGYVRLERPRHEAFLEDRFLSRLRPPPPPPLPAPEEEPAPRPLDPLRESGLFDEDFYVLSQEARNEGRDPLEHYLEIGEARGIQPSARFEPAYYARRYPDVRAAGMGLLRHYALFGQNEGREGLSPARRLVLPELAPPRTERVLVVLHEASRTGAPILGWDLIQRLHAHRDVVVLLKKGGSLRPSLDDLGVPVIDLPPDAALAREDLNAVGQRLAETLRPSYAIANSAETRDIIAPLALAGVGVIALIHEFSANVRPRDQVHDILVWAHRLVFPARVVADSFLTDHPYLAQRHHEILPQGLPLPPRRMTQSASPDDPILARLRPQGCETDFLVVGLGRVQLRKGVDLFLSMASQVLRARPDARIRFAWVGDGYSPDDWTEFPTYLTDQINREGLDDRFILAGEVDDLSKVHAIADLVVLTSRLDPMPNTSIEALSLGVPVVCFDRASGIAEILSADEDTRTLVVPYLDTAAMARVVLDLHATPDQRETLSQAARRVASARFDMTRYVETLDGLGRETRDTIKAMEHDRAVISATTVFDPAFYRPVGEPLNNDEALKAYLLRNRLTAKASGNQNHVGLRRPFPGFNPLSYAEALGALDGDRDPLALWLEAGRPAGPWLHPVIDLKTADSAVPANTKVLLHGHFHYVDLVEDFLGRLAADGLVCDLVLTTTDEDRAIALRHLLEPRANTRDLVRVVPNRGRDIGAFLTGVSDLLDQDYQILGHVHGKKSVHLGDGDLWRDFLWENLIGGQTRAASAAVSALLEDPDLGLIFPEDPNLCGWDLNGETAADLARRMGRTEPLPRFPDWPNGTMFWARREALAPLFTLGLGWEDYPEEPAPVDGSLLHALERLIPFAAERAGLAFATTHLPGVNR